MTEKFAVLGSPIEHSLSPKIHNFVFAELELDASYERFELSDGLGSFLETNSWLSGVSLTMPLKDEGYALSNSLSEMATKTKSVNTLLRTPNGFSGFNTDVYGIRRAVGITPVEVAILGSGATARSALAAFPDAKKILFARDQSKATQLASEYHAKVVSATEALDAEVVISTLPVGVLATLLGERTSLNTLLDVAYTNPELDAARYISGLEMLIHQAIAQQRIFQFGDENHELAKEAELLEKLYGLLNVAK